MKRFFILISVLLSLFSLIACSNDETENEEETMNSTDYEKIWDDEYQDSNNSFTKDTIKSSKLFYDGKYFPLDTNVSKRKDNKKEFYTTDSMRFVNSPEGYAFTIPANEVSVDYSIAKYRVQFEFGQSTLTVSHETKNPYGNTSGGWNIYLNEWVNRYIANPKYLMDNNLEYSREVITSSEILPGFEVMTYSIFIKDSDGIDKPYYDISIVRENKEYVEFYLFVMKSKSLQSDLHDEIIKSFKTIKKVGYSNNYAGQYESKANPNWNEETLNYFNKINSPDTFEFGFFSYSLCDDTDTVNRDNTYQKVITENERLYKNYKIFSL